MVFLKYVVLLILRIQYEKKIKKYLIIVEVTLGKSSRDTLCLCKI